MSRRLAWIRDLCRHSPLPGVRASPRGPGDNAQDRRSVANARFGHRGLRRPTQQKHGGHGSPGARHRNRHALDGAAAGTDSGSGTHRQRAAFSELCSRSFRPMTVSGVAKRRDRSDAIIAALDALGGWGNGNACRSISRSFLLSERRLDSAPDDHRRARHLSYCYGGPDCDAVPLQMPIPANGNAKESTNYVCDATNGDCHVLVLAKDEKSSTNSTTRRNRGARSRRSARSSGI